VPVDGGQERAHDIAALDRPEGLGGEQQAGVVIHEIEDLDVAPVGQAPVGRVGLPQLVGQGGLEPDERRARPLVRLGRDQVVTPEDAPDRRRRRGVGEPPGEVVGDRRRATVVAGRRELGAQLNDGRLELGRRPARRGAGSP